MELNDSIAKMRIAADSLKEYLTDITNLKGLKDIISPQNTKLNEEISVVYQNGMADLSEAVTLLKKNCNLLLKSSKITSPQADEIVKVRDKVEEIQKAILES